LADKRQRRKRRQAERAASREAVAERYARGREKDEAIRRSLEPVEPGERPGAVTVGAIVAAVAAVANLVALIVAFDPDSPNKSALTLAGFVVLVVVAVGMWRGRYWAVLGMQTVLALTILSAFLALVNAGNVLAVVLVIAIVASAGTLFWYLVRAMARIQMPERPGASR
jgi:hypothetical protein